MPDGTTTLVEEGGRLAVEGLRGVIGETAGLLGEEGVSLFLELVQIFGLLSKLKVQNSGLALFVGAGLPAISCGLKSIAGKPAPTGCYVRTFRSPDEIRGGANRAPTGNYCMEQVITASLLISPDCTQVQRASRPRSAVWMAS